MIQGFISYFKDFPMARLFLESTMFFSSFVYDLNLYINSPEIYFDGRGRDLAKQIFGDCSQYKMKENPKMRGYMYVLLIHFAVQQKLTH